MQTDKNYSKLITQQQHAYSQASQVSQASAHLYPLHTDPWIGAGVSFQKQPSLAGQLLS